MFVFSIHTTRGSCLSFQSSCPRPTSIANTAIARALITKPQLILADEPSGALDSKAADSLMNLFTTINQEGQTIVMVTHSVKAASSAKRVLFIKDGKVFHQLYRGNLTNEEMYERISDTLKILTTGGEEDE